jgi:hypothetical protein
MDVAYFQQLLSAFLVPDDSVRQPAEQAIVELRDRTPDQLLLLLCEVRSHATVRGPIALKQSLVN